MKTHRIPWLPALLALAITLVGANAGATTLSDIFAAAEKVNAQATRSQTKIDALTEETRALYNDYKVVLKEIEGLRVYNGQLERQIGNQETEMAQIADSIDKVTVIERQITPLMMRMVDGLEQFVELDLPFLIDERRNRVENLRVIMERADVAVSEKLSQVLRAYQIENEYGRTMEAYGTSINVDGSNRIVDVLKVGRVALVYQTSDGEETGVWNAGNKAWEQLSDEFTTPVRNGIRMARKQLSVDMLILPIQGAE